MQNFSKPYLSHPDSELGVLYMNLDLLDEPYPMVKSKLPFEDFDQGGLTGYAILELHCSRNKILVTTIYTKLLFRLLNNISNN
jgi:hypothetical protein